MEPNTNQAPQSDNLTTAQLSAMLASERQDSSRPDPNTQAEPVSEQGAGGGAEADPALVNPPDPETPEPDPIDAPPAEAGEALAAYPGAGVDPEITGAQADAAEAKADVPKAIQKLQTRVGKVVDQRERYRNRCLAAEAELAETKAQLERNRAEPLPTVTATSDPIDSDPAVRSAVEQAVRAEKLLEFATDNPDGGEFGEGPEKVTLTPEQVATIARHGAARMGQFYARIEATRQAAMNRQAAERQQAEVVGRKTYPALFDKSSAEFRDAQQVVRLMPALGRLPNVELLVGDYLAGRKAREAAAKAPARPAPRPAPVVAATAHVAPKPESRRDQVARRYQEAKADYEKTGTAQARSKMLAIQRELQQHT